MSTRHYTINQFFRQMPNELLARYFYSCSEFKGFDFKSAEDINPHDLLRQWSSLPEDVRTEHEITFREIHSLSCEKGFYAILDELKWQLRADITRAEEIQPNYQITSTAPWLPTLTIHFAGLVLADSTEQIA